MYTDFLIDSCFVFSLPYLGLVLHTVSLKGFLLYSPLCQVSSVPRSFWIMRPRRTTGWRCMLPTEVWSRSPPLLKSMWRCRTWMTMRRRPPSPSTTPLWWKTRPRTCPSSRLRPLTLTRAPATSCPTASPVAIRKASLPSAPRQVRMAELNVGYSFVFPFTGELLWSLFTKTRPNTFQRGAHLKWCKCASLLLQSGSTAICFSACARLQAINREWRASLRGCLLHFATDSQTGLVAVYVKKSGADKVDVTCTLWDG